MDLQHLNILFHVFHGFAVAGDFALCDETVVESMAAGSLIAMLDDACLKWFLNVIYFYINMHFLEFYSFSLELSHFMHHIGNC